MQLRFFVKIGFRLTIRGNALAQRGGGLRGGKHPRNLPLGGTLRRRERQLGPISKI